MTIVHGFELIEKREIPEIGSLVALYRHAVTGAELLSISNNDENKVFSVSLRTPPEDSTGVAHILEHSVLCGSRKYPVKEPFVELLKGSLKTFLNAFTYPDKTCYPVASQNLRDFYNLIDVYLDAVFYPRLTSHIFEQEGRHLDMTSYEDRIAYKGVVYNEMKGVYSSPDSILSELTQQSLFPDNTYGLDSGGDPHRIPDLTFEQFCAFHRDYYHPSNARIFFYGNDDPEARLKLIDDFIADFGPRSVNSSVPLQPSFPAPRKIRRSFAAGEEEGNRKGMMTVAWLLPETAVPETNLAFQILNRILIGMPGSPLRKALIDSGLGEALTGSGLENELRQMYFSVGLKGMEPVDADRVETLIFDTLDRLARDGVEPGTVDAALNTLEFRLRENNSGSFPRGIALMLRALTTWLYDRDPFALLAFEKPLANLKADMAASPSYFPGLIRRYLLDNPHRSTVILEPDTLLREREEAEEQEQMEALRRSMTFEELADIVRNTLELRKLQETPDSPEALATIPLLKVSDLEKDNKIIPLEISNESGSTVLLHELATNGILYLDIALDLHSLPQELLPYAPLFGRALVEMGTKHEDYVSFTQRIGTHTGGIYSGLFTSTRKTDRTGAVKLTFRGKCMIERSEEFFAILRDMLLDVKLDDRERFRQMALEEKAGMERRIVPNGHQMANLRIRAHFSEGDWAAEQMSGISYLLFLRELVSRIDDDWPGVLAVLESIRERLVTRRSMLFNATLDGRNLSDRRVAGLARLIEALPDREVPVVQWVPSLYPCFEGLVVPSQVNYVGKGANLYDLGFAFDGSFKVVIGYLRNSWLWDRVRVQGGAYGAMCAFDRLTGVLTFLSYRDPNFLKTVENFDASAEFLRTAALDEDEISKAIISAIGALDAYLLPDAAGYVSMARYITEDGEDDRRRMREEILAATREDFRAFADVLAEVKEKGIVKMVGSRGAMGRPEDWPSLPDIRQVL